MLETFLQKEGAVTTKRQDPLEALGSVEVSSIQEAEGLQVYGLKWPLQGDLDYMTLDEALQQEVLDVTEFDEGGRVPTIKIVNKSNRLVFLMAGELLVGCKQDRVLNTSMIVPAKSEMPIPVTCVEAGRWGYQSNRFRSGESSSHSYLRMMVTSQSSAHYKARGVAGSDQQAVWKEVERKMGKMGSSSASSALHEIFQDYDEKLNKALETLSTPGECNGAAFAIRGRPVGVDLFDKTATLAKLWPKLIKGYAMDALEGPVDKPKPLEPESVITWLKSVRSAKQESFKSPGLGQDVRIAGEQLVGSTLVVDEHPVHLQLFSSEDK